MNFLEKLDFMINRYGLNKRSLSIKSGIPYTTIDAWYKKGYENLKLSTLRKLCSFFNTSLDFWFVDEILDPGYGKVSALPSSEQHLLAHFRRLDEIDQAKIIERMETMLEADKYQGKDASKSTA